MVKQIYNTGRTPQNDFSIGDGTASDKSITANNAAATKPRLRYNNTTSKWQVSNDGVNYTDIRSDEDGPFKQSRVKAFTDANITLSGNATVDDIVLATGDRVLCIGQLPYADRGVYVVNTAGAWARAIDADSFAKLGGSIFSVCCGTLYAGCLFICTSASTGTIGVDSVDFLPVPIKPYIDASIQISNQGKISSKLVIADQAEGDIVYRNATEWTRLPKGTAGQKLVMNAGETAPEWVDDVKKPFSLFISGTLTTASALLHVSLPYAMTLGSIKFDVGTPVETGDLNLEVTYGTDPASMATLFASVKPEIEVGATASTDGTLTTTALAQRAYVSITMSGTFTAAANMTIHFYPA